jgi:hypothetical protein
MTVARDFRLSTWDPARANRAGKNIGRTTYWKLYSIENAVRVVIHSILTIQIAPNWWNVAADRDMRKKIQAFQADYARQPWHTPPGPHELYYAQLGDLNKIIRANSNLFLPIIPDIDQWIARIEQIRLPRNVVAHMNWPNANDRRRIDLFQADIESLVGHLSTAGLNLIVP